MARDRERRRDPPHRLPLGGEVDTRCRCRRRPAATASAAPARPPPPPRWRSFCGKRPGKPGDRGHGATAPAARRCPAKCRSYPCPALPRLREPALGRLTAEPAAARPGRDWCALPARLGPMLSRGHQAVFAMLLFKRKAPGAIPGASVFRRCWLGSELVAQARPRHAHIGVAPGIARREPRAASGVADRREWGTVEAVIEVLAAQQPVRW